MLQPRICLLGLLPFRPIIRIGCRPTPAECGLDRPAARARLIAGVRITRLHGSAILGSVRRVPADSHGPAKMRGPARPQVRSEDRSGSEGDSLGDWAKSALPP